MGTPTGGGVRIVAHCFLNSVLIYAEESYEMNLLFCYPLPLLMSRYLTSYKCRQFWTAPE